MLRIFKAFVAVLAVAGVAAATALAVSNAHFVGTPTVTRNDNTLTVSGKVAGLGDVDVITVSITGDANCVNPGTNKPKAANKASVSGGADVPVQNGKANFSVTTDPIVFQPDCTPPMTVVFSNIVVTVTAADGTHLEIKVPGTL